MRDLAERLLRMIRKEELLRAGGRVGVALSGGADSVALLLLLAELRRELGIVLSVVHVNHKLRGSESDEDERFVADLATALELELATHTAPITGEPGIGIEGEARRLRYQFFTDLVREGRISKIATAHTLDDQAETVLLRMFRGTGIRGLGGIRPRLQLKDGGRVCGEVVRPLLGFRRSELREFLRARGQGWREDSSNEDVTFLRNRVRQRLLPIIAEEFGDAALEHMAELAEIARAEEEWVASTSAQYAVPSTRNSQVDSRDMLASRDELTALGVKELLALPLAAARRSVRAWIETNAPGAKVSFRLIEEILELARGTAGKTIELPGRATADTAAAGGTQMDVRRKRDELALEKVLNGPGDYEYLLAVPGEVCVPELGTCFRADVVDVNSVADRSQDELLDPALVGARLVIRNWRAGDRYWPAHTKQKKKVKELLGDRHATGMEKKLWPVAIVRGEIVWMRGFAVPEASKVQSGTAVWIREISRS
jgi:tRNA(Ile)-lysidine synthase